MFLDFIYLKFYIDAFVNPILSYYAILKLTKKNKIKNTTIFKSNQIFRPKRVSFSAFFSDKFLGKENVLIGKLHKYLSYL